MTRGTLTASLSFCALFWACGSSPAIGEGTSYPPEEAAPPTPTCEANRFSAPCWLLPANAACRVWNASPKPGESATYDGPCVDGLAHGDATLRWSSGNIARGTYERGRVVRGEIQTTDGARLDGRFPTTDTFVGTATWPPFGRYEGRIVDGRYEGDGFARWENGDLVLGSFEAGLMHGECVIIRRNGAVVSGTWRRGKLEGDVQVDYGDVARVVIPYRDGRADVARARFFAKADGAWVASDAPAWGAATHGIDFDSTGQSTHLEAWTVAGADGGRPRVISFRMLGDDARELFDALALPTSRVTDAAPTYGDGDAPDASALAWDRKRIASRRRGTTTTYALECYRLEGARDDVNGHHVCRVDIVVGPRARSAQLRFVDDAFSLTLVGRGRANDASALHDAMRAPSTPVSSGEKRTVTRRAATATSGRWRLRCTDHGAPSRICELHLAAPDVTRSPMRWRADGTLADLPRFMKDL